MLALTLAACPAAAQEPSTGTLTLVHTLREALEKSPEVAAAMRRAEEAGLEEAALLAELDPRLEGSYGFTDDRAPRAIPAFEGSFVRVERWDVGVAQNTLLGTRTRLAFSNEKLRSPALFRTLDPSLDSRLSLELSQPLLRYFWGRPDVARRRRARSSEAAARSELRRARADAAMRAARAHLELHNARGQLRIKEEGVNDARLLLSKYEEKRRYGLVEESDLLQARAALELQETELLMARSQLERSRHALLAALTREDSTQVLEPAEPEGLPPEPAALSDAALVARRPELEAARAQVQSLEWNLRVARLDTMAELSVNASYGVAGLDTGYGGSWKDLSSLDHAVKSAGVALSVPFSFRRERITRRQAQLRLEVARAEERRLQNAALQELRDAREALGLARRRLEAGRRLAEIERRKFQAEDANARRGRSSTDLLIRFQQDIRRAQSELLRAGVDEALARLELARCAGVLLEGLGL